MLPFAVSDPVRTDIGLADLRWPGGVDGVVAGIREEVWAVDIKVSSLRSWVRPAHKVRDLHKQQERYCRHPYRLLFNY